MTFTFQDDLFTITKDQKRVVNLKSLFRTLFTILYSIFILSTAVLVLNQYYSLPGIVAIGFNSSIFLCLYVIVEWFNLPTLISCKSLYSSIHRKIQNISFKGIFLKKKINELSDKMNIPEKELELEDFTDFEYKENNSESEKESGIYNFAFEHHPSIPRAASDDWVAAMPRLQKQVMSTEYYTNKFYMLKGVDLAHWGITASYPTFTQIIKKMTELIKLSIDICLRQTQTPAYQTGHIIKSMLWSGVYIWATTRMHRNSNNDPWNFKNIPKIYYFFESTFLWMLSYDYIIGLMAIWYRKESTVRYIFSFYQIIDFLSLPPFVLLIITISPLYESSQSWLLIFLRLFRTEYVLDMLFPHVSAIKRRIIGIFAGAITIILTHAGAIFTIESPSQKNYNTLFDYFYYSIVTIGTVGYGDFSPQKREGRLVTIIVITLTLVLLPHEFQRLKEALNTPPASIGSFIRKNDTFLCIIGPIPPKQLLYIIKNLSQQKQRKFKSIVLITPINITEYQNIVKISQQRGYIRISIKQGSIGSAINSIVQCSSFILIYGSQGSKYIDNFERRKEIFNYDFDALLAAMCLSNLKGLNEKLFLIFHSSQIALMTGITSVLGSISIEIMKTKLLSKSISNCPGFITILLHFILPKNENMLKKLQEPPKNAYFISQADKSMITPYEWKCRWRGLHFKVYTFKFPNSFYGYPIKIFTKYIYKHLGIFLIGIYCPSTHKTYLNPHLYIIGETFNGLYEHSNYMGIVLSSSFSLVKKAELLESPKRYEGFISKVGKRSCSPLFEFCKRSSTKLDNRNYSFEFKDQANIQEDINMPESQKNVNLYFEKYLNRLESIQNLEKLAEPSIQIKKNLENSYLQIYEKKVFGNIQTQQLTHSNPHSISYDDQGIILDNLKQISIPPNSDDSLIINEINNCNKCNEIAKILPSHSTCYSQININCGSEINADIPIVSCYTEAISKVFVNREYPLVLIIGWYERLDILIKSTFSLRPSNFIILHDQKFDSKNIQEEFIGRIAQVQGIGTSANDQRQAGVLIASRIIIFDSLDSRFKDRNKLIDVNQGMFAVSSWLTMCFVFSKYKKNNHNSRFVGQKMPPFIIDIKESDIGLLMFQYTDYCSNRIDGSMNSATYKSDYLLDFFYSRQFLSGQFFVDDIINSMVPFLAPILDNNPINKSFIDHLIDGHPCWKPFNNLRHTVDEKSYNLQLEEIPFIFVNSTFYNLFSQLLKHGRLAIGIFRPLRVDDRQYSQKCKKNGSTVSPNVRDYPSIIFGNSVLDCFNCETHIIISCPPPKFKIHLGDCVYVL